MAKAKKETQASEAQPQDQMAEMKAQLDKIEETLENFRTSFKNLENQLTLLKDRNRLR